MDKKVLCAGRIWAIREHGAVVFMDLKDEYGNCSDFVSKENPR